MEDDEERSESLTFSRGGYYPTEDITLWMNVEAYILRNKSGQHFVIGSLSAVLTLISLGVSIYSNKNVIEDMATISTILLFLFFFYTVHAFFKSFVYFVQGEQHTKNSDMPDSFRGILRMYFCSMLRLFRSGSVAKPDIPTVPTTIQLLETEIQNQPGPSNVPTAAERAQHGRSMELEPAINVVPSPRRPRGRSLELLVPGRVPSGETPSPQRGRQGRSLDLIPEQGPSTSGQTLFTRHFQSVRNLPHHRSDVLQSNVVHPFVPQPTVDRNSFPQYRSQGRTTSTHSLPHFSEGASQRQARFPVDRAVWVPPRGATDPEQQSKETEDKSAVGS